MKKFKIWLIHKCGGYSSLQEAVKNGENATEILTLAVKHLYNTIGADDILKIRDDGVWLYKGRPLSKEEVKQLKAEAVTFQKYRLWEVLQNDIAYMANKKMYLKAESITDIIAGKLWVYTFDCIKTRLKEMLE